jgi:hypothetical protein
MKGMYGLVATIGLLPWAGAAITRLRFVMEDPTQLLSNSVAHFVIDQLCEHNNQPELVVIPGFSKVSYPTREHGTLP